MKTTKKLQVLKYELPVKIERERYGGYIARCTVWQDCYAQGDTIDEAVSEIISVASSLIELYKEENIKIPLKSVKSEKSEFTVSVITSP